MRWFAAAIIAFALPASAGASFAPRTPPRDARAPGFVNMTVLPAEPTVENDLRDVRRRIDQRRENGELSRREARALKREARLIARLAYRYGQDGVSDAERGELQLRARELRGRADVTPAR